MTKKDKKMMGHNNPPIELEDLINDQGRVRINNKVMSLLRPIPDPKDPKGERYLENKINDSDVLGFKAKANAGGSRSYFFQYKPKGIDEEKTAAARAKNPNAKTIYRIPVKIHLGKFFDKREQQLRGHTDPGITPATARKLATELRSAVKVGHDPFAIIDARRKAKTLTVVYSEFIKNRVKSAAFKKKTQINIISSKKVWIDLKSHRIRNKQIRMQHKAALSIGSMKMVDIDKDDLIKYHNAVSNAGKYQANRCIEYLRLVFKYALEKKYIKKNICSFKKKELNKELHRMDIADPYDIDEFKRIRMAGLKVAKMDYRSYSSCYAILTTAFVGGRSLSEIFSLEWDQINMVKKEIRYLDTKSNKPQIKPFGSVAAAIFRIMLRIRHATKPRDPRYRYVFPTPRFNTKVKHIQDPRKTFKRICKIAKVEVKPIHFLRHTWATIAAEATGDIEAVRAIGGWRNINSVMIYIKFLKRRKIAGVAKIDKFMASHA